ncbi:MAG: hypothetical protein IJ200_04440 [Prevotella sp.]|nr:hypothetical protein [Prevotella sp.]
MKKKLQFLTKTLLVVAALCMGSMNAWAQTIGNTDYTSGYLGAKSVAYDISSDGTWTFKFVNHNSGSSSTWENWLLEGNDGSADKFVLRADDWENIAGNRNNTTTTYSGSALVTDLNGATVDMTVTRSSGTLIVTAVMTPTTSTPTWTNTLTYDCSSDATLKLYLSIQAAYLTLNYARWAADGYATTNVLSQDYESYAAGDINATMTSSGWTFQSRNNKNEVKIVQGETSWTNATKYFNFYYPDGGANRNQYWDFGVASSLNADNWTLTFSAALNPGTGNSENMFFVTGSNSGNVATANTEVTNPFLKLKATASPAETYKPTIGATTYDDELTLTNGTWYKFTIKATNIDAVNNTIDLYVKITSYDDGTTIWEKTVTNLSTTAIGTLRGLCWNSPRGSSNLSLDNILLTKETAAGTCENPTSTITGTYNNSRKFTLDCATAASTIYYSETEKSYGDAGWVEYTGEVTTSATTIYMYAETSSAHSSVTSFATGAGTTIQLDAPVINFSELVLNSNIYHPVYTFTAPQSVLGSPVATITYSFDASSPVEGTSYTATASGTLTVTASADGYASKSTELVISNAAYGIANTLDLTDVDYVDVSGWGGGTASARWANFSSMSATIYALPETTSLPGLTISNVTNTQFAPGFGLGISSGTRVATVNGAVAGQIGEFVLYTGGKLDDAKNASQFVAYSSGISFTIPLTSTSKALKKIVIYQPIPASVSKAITAAGWSTYCSPYALDLANVTGTLTDAYIVTGGAAGVLSKTSVKDGTVAANTGLLLKGSGEITIPVVASGTDHSASNKLVGVTASETLTANSGYVLMTSPSLAFYKNNNDFTLSANSAYLPTDFDGSSAPVFLLFSGSETTGINAVQGSQSKANGEYYNLNGQRVAQPTKGLYIVNGKKVVVK